MERNSSIPKHGDSAPKFSIPKIELGAVEIPAIVQNPDRAIKAFGRTPNLQYVLDPLRNSIPLYMNPESPFIKPLMSHNARSHNIVLKISVPKRTGRKRKRGSDGPWIDCAPAEPTATSDGEPQVCSTARLDDPLLLKRRLEDTAHRYEVEAVGTVKHTHRFRGLSDFYWDMSRSSFAQKYVNQVMPGEVAKMRDFKFQLGTDLGPQVDILPPPLFTHMTMPFNYQYSQNPYVRATEDGEVVNVTAVKLVGYFVGADEPTPTSPQRPLDTTDPSAARVLGEMKKAFEERPIWTRRSLLNRLEGVLEGWNELKKYLNYVAYQFKGGPWRDAVVPYGIDPRTSPEYRQYQTLMFKLHRRPNARAGRPWHSIRLDQDTTTKSPDVQSSQSHMFDGKSYSGDGKIWQVCDITDPLLKGLFDNAEPRETWDMVSGWYHGGLWAKVKGIMKTKLMAIQFDRRLEDSDFALALQASDASPVRNPTNSHGFQLLLPSLDLTQEELKQMGKQFPKGRRNRYSTGYATKIRDIAKVPDQAEGEMPAEKDLDSALEGADSGIDEEAGSDSDEEYRERDDAKLQDADVDSGMQKSHEDQRDDA